VGLVSCGEDDDVNAVRVSLATLSGCVGYLRGEVAEWKVLADDDVLGQWLVSNGNA